MDKEKPQKSGRASLASFPEELETITSHMESKEIRPRDPKYDPLPAVPRITDEGSTHVYEDLNNNYLFFEHSGHRWSPQFIFSHIYI